MNLIKSKVGKKVGTVLLLIITIIVVANGLFAYLLNRRVVLDEKENQLNMLVDFQERRLENAIIEMEQDLRFVEENILVKQFVSDIKNQLLDSIGREKRRHFLNESLFSKIEEIHDYEDVIITNIGGEILYQQSNLSIDNGYFKEHLNRRIANFHFDRMIIQGKKAFTYASHPLKDEKGEEMGVIYCKVDLVQLLKEITHISEFGKNITISYGIKSGNQVTQFQVTRKKDLVIPSQPIFDDQDPMFLACMGNAGEGFFTDFEKNEILIVYRPMVPFNIGIMAEMNKSAIYESIKDHFISIFFEGSILYLITIGLGLFSIHKINRGLVPIKEALLQISQGTFPETVRVRTKDEYEEIAQIINNHVGRLEESAEFADQIGNGDLSTNTYQAIGSHDTLGLKLVKMRQNLQGQDITDNNRDWVMTGLAELGAVLRDYQNIKELSDGVVQYLSERIGAVNGKMYLANVKQQEMKMISAYAFDKHKALEKVYTCKGGASINVVTDVFKEEVTIYRTEVPDNYYFINSGLKEETGPRSILMVPLISDGEIFGVIDFASYEEFTPSQISFIEEVSKIIARTIFNIEVNDRTKVLLENSQKMSNELQEKQAILQENALEMVLKSEEVEKANKDLETQISEVKNAQNRTHILLENASEVITIYDKEGIVRYISPSVETILGYSQEDLLDKNDLEHVHWEHQDSVRYMFGQLVNTTEEQTIQFSFYKKDGSEIWLESRGKNMLKDPAIHGIVINTSDITERRRATEEQRKRGQMQALSENSLDLITRIDADGSFFYINPTIKTLTGFEPEQYLSKKIAEVGLNEDVADLWTYIMNTVIDKRTKKSCEMEFPTAEGTRIMMVNAMPEFDAKEEKVESVLLVSHDITEGKKKENEIKLKNKKISDSINYAERIQSTILPDNDVLRKLLPKSFMIFRPKDIVSGDFPWIFHHGDEVILAAVDCTGHGVPGAMISLVGYFLLEETVVGKGIYKPDDILNELDRLVTSTFRQNDENSKIKDGMDVAICRINTKTGHLDYSGAHRPMYVVRKDGEEVAQLKGDRFPIGGGSAFRNKTFFQNFEIDLERGDAFYFFSDGLPDQFGGPDDRKLGPKRIRTFIQENKGIDMLEMEHKMAGFLDDWKGSQRQFDDIIIFGVEF